jgi:hypothetical protein
MQCARDGLAGHLAGSSSNGKPQEDTAVRAAHAFDAPELLVQFTGEMRHKAEQLGATAAVLIAPTSAVAFPQVGLAAMSNEAAACPNSGQPLHWLFHQKAGTVKECKSHICME